jgi:carboxylate-amine ligase
VEIRVCDTPLTVEKACQLAAFAQALGVALASEPMPDPQAWQAYRTNRFQAARFGLHGNYVDARQGRVRLLDHTRETFERLRPVARELGTLDMLEALHEDCCRHGGDAKWLRDRHEDRQDISEVVEAAVDAWRGAPERTAHLVEPPRRRVRASSEPIAMDGLGLFSYKRLDDRLH